MPEEILETHFKVSKLESGTPVKVSIYSTSTDHKHTLYGYITESTLKTIYVGYYNINNNPVSLKITVKQLLEELVKIEILN